MNARSRFLAAEWGDEPLRRVLAGRRRACIVSKTRNANAIVKKRNSRSASNTRRDTVLPDDACPACRTLMKASRRRIDVTLGGKRVSVPGVRHLRCPKCDEIVLRFPDAKRSQQAAMALCLGS